MFVIICFCYAFGTIGAMQQQEDSSLYVARSMHSLVVVQPDGESDFIQMDPFVQEIYKHIALLSVDDAVWYVNYQLLHCSTDKIALVQEVIVQLNTFKIAHDRYLETLTLSMQNLKKNASIEILATHYMHQDGLAMAQLIVCAFGLQYQNADRATFGWLHHAALFENQCLVEWLLAQAPAHAQNVSVADFINMRNVYGHTALDEAEAMGSDRAIAIAQLLRANGGLHGSEIH